MNRNVLPIGGFFELEIPPPKKPVHRDGMGLATGRSCLTAILKSTQPTRCHVPHYTCDATLTPFHQNDVEILFYELDAQLQPLSLPELDAGDCFLFTNYWGLQRELAASLSDRYGERLIIDDTHDFDSYRRYPQSWSFTSARKYFGVPDGAVLYVPDGVVPSNVVPPSTPVFQQISLQHSVHRLQGFQEQAYAEFQSYETSLPSALYRISSYSQSVLSMIDMKHVFERRRENFLYLSQSLDTTNAIRNEITNTTSPFVYPYLPRKPIRKQAFHSDGIFIATFWPDVLNRPSVTCATAMEYARHLIPFPIDHRYGETEMQRMIDVTRRLEQQP